jgi:hypothetical protein
MFTGSEEEKCSPPQLFSCASDDDMIVKAFERAELLSRDLDASRSTVAIIAFSDDLFGRAEQFAAAHGKPIEIIKRRGDTAAVERAQRARRWVLPGLCTRRAPRAMTPPGWWLAVSD